ncbi:hypothetical protein SLS56_008088 [Neofusicoccum ribis]|uniref:Nephrocystin 3-like N-terminal domain-containing protein n=1 Tax=Neofusicoccum ribis TaxID=45134 RepID=A0ABR3SL07_9PEZI
MADTYVRSYDKIVEAMMGLATALPEFHSYTQIFQDNDQIKHVLCLFYKDILDFHATVLRFFKLKSWRFLLESVWPKYDGKLKIILGNIAKNRALMDSTVSNWQKTDAYEKYKRDYEFQQRQDFETAKISLSPNLYYNELGKIGDRCSVDSMKWLHGVTTFENWLDSANDVSRLLWLQGIPGADPVAFVLLSHQFHLEGSLLKALHSITFQLANSNKNLRPLVSTAYNEKVDQLLSSTEFSNDLLKDLLRELLMTYIVIDGLDEIAEPERIRLLSEFLKLCDAHDNVKLLISSRAEQDIQRQLCSKAELIRVHDGNDQVIQTYVDERSREWISTLPLDVETAREIQKLMRDIGPRSKGSDNPHLSFKIYLHGE